MKARVWLALLAALALWAAGCGGGDDESDTTAPAVAETQPIPLSTAELISQGDAICAEVNAAVGTVSATDADSASRAAQEANLYEGMVDRLKGLGRPDDRAGYQQFISAADELAQAQSDAALAAARGDTAALQAAQSEASGALESFQEAAGAYGFEECGEAPSAPAAATTPSESGGFEAVEEEAAPEAEPEAEEAPDTGGAGAGEERGGAAAGGGPPGEGTEGSGGGSSGGIGPG